MNIFHVAQSTSHSLLVCLTERNLAQVSELVSLLPWNVFFILFLESYAFLPLFLVP